MENQTGQEKIFLLASRQKKHVVEQLKGYFSGKSDPQLRKQAEDKLELHLFSKQRITETILASLLLHDGSEIGSIDGLLKMDVRVGDVTVPSGATVNVASTVFNEANISGDVTLDFYADVEGIEMTSDSVVIIGGANFE